MEFSELVNIIKNKEQSSKQQTKNKQRTKVLRKRIKNG
tara:strand:- start:290 stop:403 length:114 start_codon:yes stop_codon:yes gene_type:complete